MFYSKNVSSASVTSVDPSGGQKAGNAANALGQGNMDLDLLP